MRDQHEPTDEFIERLEWQVGREVRRRNRAVPLDPWILRSRMRATMVAAALVVVSMSIGAAGMAAAYQVQGNERRDALAAGLQRQVDLARLSVQIANERLQEAERQVSMGLANNLAVVEGREKVVEAEAHLKVFQLQIDEVRATGRDPRTEISSPLVAGRDFIQERLRIDLTVPEAVVALEQARLQDAQRRFAVGIADAAEIERARVNAVEADLAVEAFRKKIDIRQKFLSGTMDAVETELRVLESEADQRQKTLTPQIDLAHKEVASVATKTQTGLAASVDLLEARLKLQELETELAKAELDLQLVRRQIDQHRAGR